MVEDPVVAESYLVDGVGREYVCFGNGSVAPVIIYKLIAAECVLFGPGGRATRHEIGRLIVAEATENRIISREVVVDANIPRAFVQFAHGYVDVVVPRRISHIGSGVKLEYFRADRIDHGGGDDIATHACGLGSG